MLLPLMLIGAFAVLIFTIVAGSMSHIEKQNRGSSSARPVQRIGGGAAR